MRCKQAIRMLVKVISVSALSIFLDDDNRVRFFASQKVVGTSTFPSKSLRNDEFDDTNVYACKFSS